MPLNVLSTPRSASHQAFFNDLEIAGADTPRLLRSIAYHREHVASFFLLHPSHLMRFCRGAENPVIEALFEAGVDFATVETKCQELHSLGQSLANPDTRVFRTLIEHGLDPKKPMWESDYQKTSVMMHCVQNDKVEPFAALLDAKIDSDLPNYAINKKSIRCVEHLCTSNRAYCKKTEILKLAEENDEFKAFLEQLSLDRETAPAPLAKRSMRL